MEKNSPRVTGYSAILENATTTLGSFLDRLPESQRETFLQNPNYLQLIGEINVLEMTLQSGRSVSQESLTAVFKKVDRIIKEESI